MRTWRYLEKASALLSDKNDKALYWTELSHIVDGERKNGIAVIVDNTPEETRLKRAAEIGENYIAKLGLV